MSKKYLQGSIVVLPAPFTDLSSKKQRPCLILSKNSLNKTNQDVIILAITSNPKTANTNLQYKSY